MTVDGYAHCGLDKYLPVAALDAAMRASDVSAAVLCQHLGQFDNGYIAALIRERPERFAGVALLDHRGPAWDRELAAVAEQGFRGVRFTADVLRERPGLVAAVADGGLISVVYAAEGIAPIIGPLRELAGGHPGAPLVISHLGGPRVEGRRLVAGEEILTLAEHANVNVLLSGLHMFCPFPYAALDGLIGGVLDAFGADRILWGSNFPVCGERADDYGREVGLLREGRWGVDHAAAAAIADTTARRLWFERVTS
jgi:L-fuconolactonase